MHAECALHATVGSSSFPLISARPKPNSFRLGLHRFQILPILQVPNTAVKGIHKYKYRYQYMETL